MIKLDPSITDPKVLARRIAELHDRIEPLEAEIKQLREALSDILTRFEPWSPDDYIADKAARAALGEAK